MKKYTLILFILSFILLGFNVNSASAYDSGCIGTALYSITTGQFCSASQVNYSNSYGCTSAGPYNTITGQLCSNSQNNYSNAVFNQELQFGSSGSDVIALQQILKDKGYLLGGVDGMYGRNTRSAVAKYQVANNLGPTGKADLTTLSMISSNSLNPYPPYPCPLTNNNYYPSTYYPCPSPTGQSPVISGVSGPQSLNVNQQGTWTVTAYSSNGGNLSYSVNWGDQPIYAYSNNSSTYPTQQSATLSHIYSQMGTYTPIFTVTNSSGQTVQTSLSVVVNGGTVTTTPIIYSLSPTYGVVGSQVTIYGSGFVRNNCTGTVCTMQYVTPNTINFGSNVIQNAYSYDGTSLTFTVPSYTSPACLYSNPACYIAQSQITPGIYPVSVTNSSGTSNAVNFSVTGYIIY